MVKSTVLKMDGKKKLKEILVGVTELNEQKTGQFKFQDMNKLVSVGTESDFKRMLFHVNDCGKLISVEYSFSPEVELNKFQGRVRYEQAQNWQKF